MSFEKAKVTIDLDEYLNLKSEVERLGEDLSTKTIQLHEKFSGVLINALRDIPKYEIERFCKEQDCEIIVDSNHFSREKSVIIKPNKGS